MSSHKSYANGWFLRVSDFVAGTVGGFAGKLIEYPFDTLKVRLQTQSNVLGSVSNIRTHVKSLIEREGYLALYRGLPLPLLGTMVETSCLFGTIGQIKKMLYGRTDDITVTQTVYAGFLCGLGVSFVVTPIELIKCRLQYCQFHQFSNNAKSSFVMQPYQNTWDCMYRTISESGIRGLYRGHLATMMREAPGTAAWFGTYELLLKNSIPEGKSRADINPLYIIIAGGLSGIAYNTAFYPADTVKTKIQIYPTHMKPNIMNIVSKIYCQEGIKGFYRGILPTVLRAMPVNGVVFLSYEIASDFLAKLHTENHSLD